MREERASQVTGAARGGPRIALISAVPGAIAPAVAAIREHMTDAEVWNILDDRLLDDATAQGGVTTALSARMRRLIDHAVTEGADGVLLTCSLYGSVALEARLTVPVLAPDQAVFADIVLANHGTVLLVASLSSARDDSVARLREALRAAGSTTRVIAVVADGAAAAVKAQDQQQLLASLDGACRPHLAEVDAVFLAQYSLAPAARELAEALERPVLSGPASSGRLLREAIGP